MKKRIFTGWTFSRAAYSMIGLLVLVQASWTQQWPGVALGLYISLMGILAFGCASGNCTAGNCNPKPDRNQKP